MSIQEWYQVNPDDTIEVKQSVGLKDLQEMVGGLIVFVNPTGFAHVPGGTEAYANDEGLLMGLERNTVAEYLMGHPLLVGPVIIEKTQKTFSVIEPWRKGVNE